MMTTTTKTYEYTRSAVHTVSFKLKNPARFGTTKTLRKCEEKYMSIELGINTERGQKKLL